MLASTPEHFFGGFHYFFLWGKARALVCSVTKRLIAALAAGAPEIGAGFHIHHDWAILRYFRLIHSQLFS